MNKAKENRGQRSEVGGQKSPVKFVPVKQKTGQVSQDKLCSFSPKNLTGQAGARACPPLEGSALKTLI